MAGPRKRTKLATNDVLRPDGSDCTTTFGYAVYSAAGATRHVDRQSLVSTRDKLLKRKKVPQRELLRTLDLLNETQAISTLPNELLVYVVELSQPTSNVLDAVNWVGRLYLCRRWYHLITSVPRFWQDIYVTSYSEWLELCLSRCQGMLVDVYITGRFSLLSTVPILEEHAQSIRGITYTVLRPSWTSDIYQLLSVTLPSLQKIDISLSTKSTRYAEIDATPENLTVLKTLKLRSCYVPNMVYSNLISLDVDRCPWSANFEHLLNALASAKSLKKVVLHNCFAKWYNIPRGFARSNPPRRPPISLQVRILQLSAIPATLASQLLAHIHVPNASHVHVDVHSTSSRLAYDIWDVLPEHVVAFSPAFSLSTSICISGTYRDYSLVARNAACDLQVHLPCGYGLNFSDKIERLLNVFGGVPVKKLSFPGVTVSSSSTWKEILQCYPTLQHIYTHLNDPFFSALKVVSQPDGRELCCPHLTSLVSSQYCPVAEDTYDLILGALRTRAERGAQLEQLILFMSDTVGKDVLRSKGPQQFEAELKPLVKDLIFECNTRSW